MHKINLIIILLPIVLGIQAQTIISPEVHADSTVTFRYSNEKAVTVRLRSDCLLRKPDNSWFGGKMRTQRMVCDSAGIFSLTTKPLEPEVYQYRFIVNGIYRHDPYNRDSAYVLLHQESIVAVGGNVQADLYVETADIPHGTIDTLLYYNEEQQLTRKILVYLPPYHTGYTVETEHIVETAPSDRESVANKEHVQSQESVANKEHVVETEHVQSLQEYDDGGINMLYLLHGISGDEASWIELGRVKQILDNMLSQGKIEPTIVVMPDCNVKNKLTPKHRTNLFRNILNYPILGKGDFEEAFPDMHRFVCGHYGLRPDKQHCYIAGLSSGAKQAANIVRDNPELFSIVGLFSPVLGKKQLPTSSQSAVWHLYVGKADMFYKNGVRQYDRLQNAGAQCTLTEQSGGHVWRNWRIFLTDFLTTLPE
ncbi:MAG: hypothetical protein IJ776_00330 [Paludibacteraceae bacterium]|nr:hypothetical protein [Paludibacteraceae bacterium]